METTMELILTIMFVVCYGAFACWVDDRYGDKF